MLPGASISADRLLLPRGANDQLHQEVRTQIPLHVEGPAYEHPPITFPKFVYDKYVWPALERGDETVTLEASEIYDGLNGKYSRHFVCDVLGSRHFRNT